MIALISGQITALKPNWALVLTPGGVGYGVHLSVNSSSTLSVGASVKLLTTLVVKEDSHRLYGFASEEEQKLFELLIKVNGVGATSAIAILSAFTPAQLQTAVMHADVATIKKAPGIGPKTAQRLILELKDKMLGFSASVNPAAACIGTNDAQSEALAALMALGFKQDAAAKALKNASGQNASELVKSALRSLK